MSFIIGVGSSLVAMVLGAVIGRAWGKNSLVRRIVGSYGLGLIALYVDTSDAKQAVRKAVASSKGVRILAGRGTEFQSGREGTYEELLHLSERTKRHWRILLPSTRSLPRGNDWIVYRASELNSVVPPYDREKLATQIETAVQELERVVVPGKFEVALYDAPHIGRVILTDDVLFLSFYSEDRGGKKGPTFQYGKGEFYNAFARYFEMLWSDAQVVSRSSTTGSN